MINNGEQANLEDSEDNAILPMESTKNEGDMSVEQIREILIREVTAIDNSDT